VGRVVRKARLKSHFFPGNLHSLTTPPPTTTMPPKKPKDEEAPSDYVPRGKMVRTAPNSGFWDADFPSDGGTPFTASGHVSRRWMTGMIEERTRHAPVSTETVRSAVQAPGQGGNNLQRRIAAMGPPIRSNQDRAVTPPSGEERANGPFAQTPETPCPVERRPNYQVNSNRAGRGRGGATMGMNRQPFQVPPGRHPSSDMFMPPPPSSMQRSGVSRRSTDARHVGAAEEEDGSAHRNNDVVPAELEEAEEEEDGNAHRNDDVAPVELNGEESRLPGVLPPSSVGRPSSQEENLPPQPTSPLLVVGQGVGEAGPQESLVVGFDSDTQGRDINARLDVELQAYRPMDEKLYYAYEDALSQGCVAAATLAHTQASNMGSTVTHDIGLCEFRNLSRNILWSMPEQVLRSIVSGNLAVAAQAELADLFDEESEWSLEGTVDAPAIYVVILADEQGLSPRPSELRQVVETLRRYVSDEHRDRDDVMTIDNALGGGRSTRQQIEQGHQRFLHKEVDGRRRRIRGRSDVVIQFCDALDERLHTIERAGWGDVPLERPLMYGGYALRYIYRVRQHDHGDSSFLMQLVRSVCQVLFPEKFNLRPFPVCFLAVDREVTIGELLFTQLANSFSWSGGGFNVHPPGINNSSVAGKGSDFWNERREFRVHMYFWSDAENVEGPILKRRAKEFEASQDYLAEPSEEKFVAMQNQTVEVLEKRLVQVLGQVKNSRAEASADLRVTFWKGVQLANPDLSGIDPAILGEVWEDLEAEDAVGMVETDDPDIAALFDEEKEPKE